MIVIILRTFRSAITALQAIYTMRTRNITAHLLCICALLLSQPLSAAVQRVISLAPHTTELAYAAGLGGSMIAASAYSDYPPEAKQLEQVASWQGINLERLLALKPDLVLAWRGGNPQRVLEQIASLGIPIFYSDPRYIDDIADDLENLAQYSPHPEMAKNAAHELRVEVARLKQRYTTVHPVRVFMQFGTQPLFTASKNTLQSDVLALCGATNVFADSPAPWPQVSREQVLMRKPQAIVIAGDEKQTGNVIKFWSPQMKVPVIAVPEDWLNRSGPRIVLAARQLCHQLSQVTLPPESH